MSACLPQVTCERLTLGSNKAEQSKSELGVYYEGLNEKLYAALPTAKRVLELGCAGGRLGERYKQTHPNTHWVGIDLNAQAVQAARTKLDRVYCLSLDEDDLDEVGTGFDCIVLGDLLEHLKRPEDLLRRLHGVAAESATLVCCVPNGNHVSVLERMLGGDVSYDDEGLLDRTHLRFYSRPSLFKMLLDCGWLPDLVDGYVVGHANRILPKYWLRVPRRSKCRRLLPRNLCSAIRWSCGAESGRGQRTNQCSRTA